MCILWVFYLFGITLFYVAMYGNYEDDLSDMFALYGTIVIGIASLIFSLLVVWA